MDQKFSLRDQNAAVKFKFLAVKKKFDPFCAKIRQKSKKSFCLLTFTRLYYSF